MSRLTAPPRRHAYAVGVVTAAAMALLPGSAALAAPSSSGCGNRTNNTYDKVLECVRVEGVRQHQAALQRIAAANGGCEPRSPCNTFAAEAANDKGPLPQKEGARCLD